MSSLEASTTKNPMLLPSLHLLVPKACLDVKLWVCFAVGFFISDMVDVLRGEPCIPSDIDSSGAQAELAPMSHCLICCCCCTTLPVHKLAPHGTWDEHEPKDLQLAIEVSGHQQPESAAVPAIMGATSDLKHEEQNATPITTAETSLRLVLGAVQSACNAVIQEARGVLQASWKISDVGMMPWNYVMSLISAGSRLVSGASEPNMSWSNSALRHSPLVWMRKEHRGMNDSSAHTADTCTTFGTASTPSPGDSGVEASDTPECSEQVSAAMLGDGVTHGPQDSEQSGSQSVWHTTLAAAQGFVAIQLGISIGTAVFWSVFLVSCCCRLWCLLKQKPKPQQPSPGDKTLTTLQSYRCRSVECQMPTKLRSSIRACFSPCGWQRARHRSHVAHLQLIPHVDSQAAAEHFKREVSSELQEWGYKVGWEGESVPQLRMFLHHTSEGRIDFRECHEAIRSNGLGTDVPLIAVFAMFHNPDLRGSPPVARCKGDAEAYRQLRRSVTTCNEWYYFPGPGELSRHNQELYSQIVSVLDGIR